MVEETELPGEYHQLILSDWQLSPMPGKDSNQGSGERQLAASVNTLDH